MASTDEAPSPTRIDNNISRSHLPVQDKKDQWNRWIVAHGAERLGWVICLRFRAVCRWLSRHTGVMDALRYALLQLPGRPGPMCMLNIQPWRHLYALLFQQSWVAHAYVFKTVGRRHLHEFIQTIPRRFISIKTILHAVTVQKIYQHQSPIIDHLETLRGIRDSLEEETQALGYGTFVNRGPGASWSKGDTELLSLIVEEILCRCGAYTGSFSPLYDLHSSIIFKTNVEHIFLSIPRLVLRGNHVDALCSIYSTNGSEWIGMMRRAADVMRHRGLAEDCLCAAWRQQWSRI